MARRGRRSRRTVSTEVPEGVVLGPRLSGPPVLPVLEGRLVWPFEFLPRHALVFGASGSGKTETQLRIAYEVASRIDEWLWKQGLLGEGKFMPMYFLDAKGDERFAERYMGVMERTGRKVRVFPHEPFDAWRGDWRAIFNRLMACIAYGTKDGPAFYRDRAKKVLYVACHHPDGPPRSSAELKERLDFRALAEAHEDGQERLRTVGEDDVKEVLMRYEGLFDLLGRALDGDWSWEDAESAYFLLDSAASEEDTASVASLLFADFAHFFKKRKPRNEWCLLQVDEFSSIAETGRVAKQVEQARGYKACLVLSPQTVSGLGGIVQQEKIFGSVHVVFVHASSEPKRLAQLVAGRRKPVVTQMLEEGEASGRASVRIDEQPGLSEGKIQELDVGEAQLVRRGRAARIAVDMGPEEYGELPPEQELDRPVNRRKIERPENIEEIYGEE